MDILLLYLVTLAVFLVADAVGLRLLIGPLFRRHVPHLLADRLRLLPAFLFYCFYIGGVVWFVSLPAAQAGRPGIALANGMLMGALAYGTYEFTNLATLRGWRPAMVAADLAWGSVLTGIAAWAGVAAAGAWAG